MSRGKVSAHHDRSSTANNDVVRLELRAVGIFSLVSVSGDMHSVPLLQPTTRGQSQRVKAI